jgi:type VI secretion system secreted protein Hcp
MAEGIRKKYGAPVAVATILAAGPEATEAASDYFLKYGDIEGEATTDGYKGFIEIDAFSWGVSRDVDPADPGKEGLPVIRSVQVLKQFDKASPLLIREVVSPRIGLKASITGVRPGETVERFFLLELEGARVRSVSVDGSNGNERPGEAVAIDFLRGCITSFDNTKTPGTETPECFDTEK